MVRVYKAKYKVNKRKETIVSTVYQYSYRREKLKEKKRRE